MPHATECRLLDGRGGRGCVTVGGEAIRRPAADVARPGERVLVPAQVALRRPHPVDGPIRDVERGLEVAPTYAEILAGRADELVEHRGRAAVDVRDGRVRHQLRPRPSQPVARLVERAIGAGQLGLRALRGQPRLVVPLVELAHVLPLRLELLLDPGGFRARVVER